MFTHEKNTPRRKTTRARNNNILLGWNTTKPKSLKNLVNAMTLFKVQSQRQPKFFTFNVLRVINQEFVYLFKEYIVFYLVREQSLVGFTATLFRGKLNIR